MASVLILNNVQGCDAV